MKLAIGTLVLKGLPPAYSRAVEHRLAGELQSMLAGAGDLQPPTVERVSARLPEDWHRLSPERFVRTLAESICREARLK